MKFAHYFKAELTAQGFPQHWVDSAVPYPQLKKIIKKVKLELKEIGLDITTFAQLIPNSDEETQNLREKDRKGSADGVVTFKYDLCSMSLEVALIALAQRLCPVEFIPRDFAKFWCRWTFFAHFSTGFELSSFQMAKKNFVPSLRFSSRMSRL
jgi:hypothetical protein